ncbi:MAG: carboxypeptidase M32 [Chlorobi bacterium]|nr:carboxypeptidase M32 [Chlorobiota bacterium]
MRTVSDLTSAAALLGWDQETYMPPLAAQARAEQIATLNALAHSMMTDERAVRLAEYFERELHSSAEELTILETRIARVFARDVRRALKVPEEFVRRKSQVVVLAQEAWKEARARASFAKFYNDLRALVELSLHEAELRGYQGHPYNALVDLYEPGMTVETLDPLFDRLEQETLRILDYVKGLSPASNAAVPRVSSTGQEQLLAARTIVEAIGFNFSAGRVDISAHPFCTSLATSDVRLTTRTADDNPISCLLGLIHEAGHGLYEQGIDPTLERTFARDGASMGIHESQSLFWENIIARSEEFWEFALPIIERFIPQFPTMTPTMMFYALNRVEPSLIRIEADEVTYNLHIIIRYRIEKELMAGTLNVAEIPERWNVLVRELLGLDVPDDANGCLQDIHWSLGAFGYFPSYTLGKLYAAMFRSALLKAMPDTFDHVRRGEFAAICQWLKENIHHWGRTLCPLELVEQVTGRSLAEKDFLEYVWEKVMRVYPSS